MATRRLFFKRAAAVAGVAALAATGHAELKPQLYKGVVSGEAVTEPHGNYTSYRWPVKMEPVTDAIEDRVLQRTEAWMLHDREVLVLQEPAHVTATDRETAARVLQQVIDRSGARDCSYVLLPYGWTLATLEAAHTLPATTDTERTLRAYLELPDAAEAP